MIPVSTILCLITILNYQENCADIQNADSCIEFRSHYTDFFSRKSNNFIEHEKRKSLGLHSVNAAWFLLLKEPEEDRDYRRFVGFVEGKLGITVPPTFSNLLIDCQVHSSGDIEPKRTTFKGVEHMHTPPSFREHALTDPADTLLALIPESKVDGQIRLMANGEVLFEQELWATAKGIRTRSFNTSFSLEFAESVDCSSIFVFGVHLETFYIVEFEKCSGERIGSFFSYHFTTDK